MADLLPASVQRLVRILGKLPGVGGRTALRFVLHLVRDGGAGIGELVHALSEVREEVGLCRDCFALAESSGLCPICLDPGRDGGALCVVESIGDVLALEATGSFRGRYFVLQRLLSPLRGVGPAEMNVPRLLEVLKTRGVSEVVLATPLTTDGETTATYLSRLLSELGLRVTRLAAGVPVGGSIEYLDRMTLGRALIDRKDY